MKLKFDGGKGRKRGEKKGRWVSGEKMVKAVKG
jgi:hypothetical protein